MGRTNRDLVESFRAKSAISKESALRLSELGINNVHDLRELKDMFAIREYQPEQYYLDEEVWAIQVHRQQRRIAMYMIAGGLVAVVLIVHYIRLSTM